MDLAHLKRRKRKRKKIDICPWQSKKKLNKLFSWLWASGSSEAHHRKWILFCLSHLVLVVVQSLSHICLFMIPWTSEGRASLPFTVSQSLLKPIFIKSVMPPNHLILCCPFLRLPSIFPSIRVFRNESAVHTRWSKYWSFSPSNEYSGFISLRTDWFDSLQSKGL